MRAIEYFLMYTVLLLVSMCAMLVAAVAVPQVAQHIATGVLVISIVAVLRPFRIFGLSNRFFSFLLAVFVGGFGLAISLAEIELPARALLVASTPEEPAPTEPQKKPSELAAPPDPLPTIAAVEHKPGREPKPVVQQRVMYVDTSRLNMRQGPDTSHSKVGSLARHTKLLVIGQDGDWLRVKADQQEGWVFGSYLTSEEPTERRQAARQQPVKPQLTTEKMWVSSDSLPRYTCPSTQCGTVGNLYFREAVNVLETRKGWVRITKYYDASCRNGNSLYVDFGWRACSRENGIVNGEFAEWVTLNSLAVTRPVDPGASATGYAKLVAKSDDYQNYAKEFEQAAIKLIQRGRCSEANFLSVGGWIRSTRKGPGMYFTYCGDGSDQVYLNVRTGRFQ